MFSFKKFFDKMLNYDIDKKLKSIRKPEEVNENNEKIIKIERYYNEDLDIDEDSLIKAEKKYKINLSHSKYPNCELFLSERDYKCRLTGDMIRFLTIDPRNICGRIVDFDDDYVYIIIDEESENGRLLLELTEKDRYNLHACGRYTSAISYPDGPKAINRIIAFDIVHDILD